MKNNKVRYTCPQGHILIARIDEDRGHPPESINCMKHLCIETATCGPAVNVDLPTMILRQPQTEEEWENLDSAVIEHLNLGGLLLFPIEVEENGRE